MDRARAARPVRRVRPPAGGPRAGLRRTTIGMSPIAQPPLPSFEVQITAPDIGRWLAGNTAVRGFTTRDSGVAGPHVALLAITHGNEIAGAIVLDRLLSTGLTPARGRLTFG